MSYGRSVLVANGIEFQVQIQYTELVSFVRYCRKNYALFIWFYYPSFKWAMIDKKKCVPFFFFGYMQSRTIFVIVIDDASSCFLFWLCLVQCVCLFYVCLCVRKIWCQHIWCAVDNTQCAHAMQSNFYIYIRCGVQ